MNKKVLDPLQKAKNYAFCLLRFRPRSVAEITERLKRKKFPTEVIHTTLAFLNEKRFVDDAAFAKAWIESRLKIPYGVRRITAELRGKGVAQSVIEEQLRLVEPAYSEEEYVRDLVKRKLERSKQLAPEVAKRRLYAFLLRRGFSVDVVNDALHEL